MDSVTHLVTLNLICAIRTLLGVDQKIPSIRKELVHCGFCHSKSFKHFVSVRNTYTWGYTYTVSVILNSFNILFQLEMFVVIRQTR